MCFTTHSRARHVCATAYMLQHMYNYRGWILPDLMINTFFLPPSRVITSIPSVSNKCNGLPLELSNYNRLIVDGMAETQYNVCVCGLPMPRSAKVVLGHQDRVLIISWRGRLTRSHNYI
jgi:hypothetical protein